MSGETLLQLGQAVHGHVGWLAVAALVHPALLLRRPGRRAAWAVRAAVVLVTLVALGGAALYPSYRTQLRPGLFEMSPTMGWSFERKEALGLFVLTFSWVGGVSAWLSERGGPQAAPLREAAALAFALAATAAAVVATLGTAVGLWTRF